MPTASDPIAVFDSGVGGLTVLHELLVSLPQEDFVYLGDTARFPYGERSAEELERFVVEIGTRLLRNGAKLLVIACNAATSAGMRSLEMLAATGIDVIGVVNPESQLAAEATRNGRIGLLATPRDGGQRRVRAGRRRGRPGRRADVGRLSRPRADHPAGLPLRPARGRHRSLVLRPAPGGRGRHRDPRLHALPAGRARCSSACSASDVELVFSGPAIARRVEHTLALRGLLNERDGEGSYTFECTGDPDAFRELGTRFLQMPLGEVRHVELSPEGALT